MEPVVERLDEREMALVRPLLVELHLHEQPHYADHPQLSREQLEESVEEVPAHFLGENVIFANNALLAYPLAFPPSSWPAGNLFSQTVNDAHFARFSEDGGGDYSLLSNSPYKNAGTDGKDLGADIAGLNAALAGIE